MSVIHEPVCRTKGCPAPKDPDWHIPWCRDIPGHECFGDATHQHVPKRSRGGKKIVACLCAGAHHTVDNTPDWDNDIAPGEDGQLEYILWDTRVEGGWNSPLICRPIDPAAGEQPNKEVMPNARRNRIHGRPDSNDQRVEEGVEAGQGASGESSAAEAALVGQETQVEPAKVVRQRVPVPESGSSAAPPLTHDERMSIAAEIRREQKQRQWKAGDTANAWEREMGEAAWQYLSDFGYQPEALSNIMKVCEAIPSERRHFEMGFTHHIVVYKLNAEDQEAWLDRCESEGWKVREFRVAVHGEKPKVKRWTLEELRQEKYGTEKQRIIILAFLDWLEAK